MYIFLKMFHNQMLCFCRGRHPYSLELQLKKRIDQIQLPRVDSCNQDAATRSAFWRILRQYFQKKSSPFFSLQRMPSFLFFIGQAFYFFQRLTFLQHKCTTHLHSATDSVVCWNFANSDEYGLPILANHIDGTSQGWRKISFARSTG